MPGTTLVRTTMVGVRPLGVRGEPLHQAQAQIRSVVRRRLGERAYFLLAEPQPHDLGGRIDWYSELDGAVRPVSSLPDAEREPVRAEIDALLADIDRLGQSLETGTAEDGRLAGRSLRLAAIRPSDDYLFLVGDQPCIVCWGYDSEAAGAVVPGAFLPASAAPPTIAAPAPTPMPPAVMAASLAPAGAAVLARDRFPWLLWLLAGLLAIAILMAASWLLRQRLPVPPDIHVTELPPEPPPPPPPPDPTIGLQADLAGALDEEAKLRATLAALRDELVRRHALCRPPDPPPKPPEPPKPPPVVERKPPPPPPPKPPDLPQDRWAKGDLGLLKGCWRLGRDATTNLRLPNGTVVQGHDRAGRICFGDNGQGTREKSSEFPGQPTIRCRAPITARFGGDGTLRTTQPRVTCDPSQFFWNDEPNYMSCSRVSDSVARCRDNLGADHEFRREGA